MLDVALPEAFVASLTNSVFYCPLLPAGTHNGVHEGVSAARPQEGPVEAEGIKIVTHAVAAPLLAAAGIADVARGVGPADAQVRRQVRGLLDVVQRHFVVPPLVYS